MKEAAGEANMTVITIVLIAVVLGVGTIIVNNLMKNNQNSSACSGAGGVWNSGQCYPASGCSTTGGKTTCTGTVLTCKDYGGDVGYTCQ